MQKIITASTVVALLALAGCAARVVSSSPRSVVVDPGGNSFTSPTAAESQRLADAECQKHGRFAALKGYLANDGYVFDCVL